MVNKLMMAACGCIIGVFLMASCSKSSKPASDPIVGMWKVTQNAYDNNNNGIIDASELVTDTAIEYLTLNSDGTGSDAGQSFGYLSNVLVVWKYLDGKDWLQLTITSKNSLGTVASWHIDKLTSSALILKDTTSGAAYWTIFAKQ